MMININLKSDDYFKLHNRWVDLYQMIQKGDDWIFYQRLKDKNIYREYLFRAYYRCIKEELFPRQRKPSPFQGSLYQFLLAQSEFIEECSKQISYLGKAPSDHEELYIHKEGIGLSFKGDEITLEFDGELEDAYQKAQEYCSYFESFDVDRLLFFFKETVSLDFKEEKIRSYLNVIQKEVFK